MPLGAQAALVCAYGPLGPSLAADPELEPRPRPRPDAATSWPQSMPQVTPQTDLLGRVNCPEDNGSAALLRFSYADQVARRSWSG